MWARSSRPGSTSSASTSGHHSIVASGELDGRYPKPIDADGGEPGGELSGASGRIMTDSATPIDCAAIGWLGTRMTIIHVSPQSVLAYGARASEIFADIISALQANVEVLTAIRYQGPNAVAFKRHVGLLSAEFGNDLYRDIVAMATAVHTATSNIAVALGGTALTIEIQPATITVGAVAEVEYVDVDTAALAEGVDTVQTQFGALRAQLEAHQSALVATDWHGNAKEAVVAIVSAATKAAIDRCTAAEMQIVAAIDAQVESVTTADGSVAAA